MFLLFQDISQDVLDKAWQITPYNALAYSALVIVLGFMAWRFYKDLAAERLENKKNLAETVEILTKVDGHLTSKGIDNKLDVIHRDIIDIKSKITN